MNWQNLYKINVVPSNRQAFGEKVISISNEMNINPNWLMGLMYFETAKTLSHTITNNIGCVGLIQFCSIARKELNVSATQLKSMSNVQQLEYVRRYFMGLSWKRNLVKKVRNVTDLYLIIFYPLAAGKSMNYVLGSHNGTYRRIYDQNPSFQDGTGKIKVQNVVDKINSFLNIPTSPPTPTPTTPDGIYSGGNLPSPVVTAKRPSNNNGGGGLLFGILLFMFLK